MAAIAEARVRRPRPRVPLHLVAEVAFDHAMNADRLARRAATYGDNAGQADTRTASTP